MSRILFYGQAEPTRPVLPSGRSGADTEAGRLGGSTSGLAAERTEMRCRLAREIASAVLCVSMEEIARPNRSVAETCRARHLAIYLAHVVFQVSLSSIAVHFGRDRTSVAHAVRRIEDRRDDEAFEQLVARLERLANACLHLAAEGAQA